MKLLLQARTYCWGLAPFFLVPVPVREAGQALQQTAEPVPGLRVEIRFTRNALSGGFATNLHE